jgi:aryl-alcohol dehydrogenase-like predicted oxidoreductase
MNHSEVPFDESLDAMIDLQKQGKIRHIGLSNITFDVLQKAVARTPIVSVQNLYNVAANEKELAQNAPHAHILGQDAIVDFCAEKGIVYFPFFSINVPGTKSDAPAIAKAAAAHGASAAQIAIAWQLARSPAMLPIPGTSSPAHLEENWAARTLELAPSEISEIASARG